MEKPDGSDPSNVRSIRAGDTMDLIKTAMQLLWGLFFGLFFGLHNESILPLLFIFVYATLMENPR